MLLLIVEEAFVRNLKRHILKL